MTKFGVQNKTSGGGLYQINRSDSGRDIFPEKRGGGHKSLLHLVQI